jgi:hypothetical protein
MEQAQPIEAAYQTGCLYEQGKVKVGLFTSPQNKALAFFKIAADGVHPHPIAAAKVVQAHEALVGRFSWIDHRTEAMRYEVIAYQALNDYEAKLDHEQFAALKEELIPVLGGEKLTELRKFKNLPRPLTAIAIGDMYMDEAHYTQEDRNGYTKCLEKANRYYEIAYALNEAYASEKLNISQQLLTKERFEDEHTASQKILGSLQSPFKIFYRLPFREMSLRVATLLI